MTAVSVKVNNKREWLGRKNELYITETNKFTQFILKKKTLFPIDLKSLMMSEIISLRRRRRTMQIIETTGTQLGIYKDADTGVNLPCIPGHKIEDPMGSGLQVPVLGAVLSNKGSSKAKGTRALCRPLAGTMKSGDGVLAPIELGKKGLDNETKLEGTCVGAKIDSTESENAGTDSVVPVILKNSVKKRFIPKTSAIRAMQSELKSRKHFFKNMSQKELGITRLCLQFGNSYITEIRKLDTETETIIKTKSAMETKMLKLSIPLNDMKQFFETQLEQEQQRRKAQLTSLSQIIQNELSDNTIIDPITELTSFDVKETIAMKLMKTEISRLSDMTKFASRRIVSEVERLRERTEQLTDKDELSLNPDLLPAAEAAKQRFKSAMANLERDVGKSVDNKISAVIQSLATVRLLRRLVETSGEQALLGLSGSNFVDTELEWGELLGPVSLDQDQPLAPLVKKLLDSLKEKDKFMLSPDAIALVDTTVKIGNGENSVKTSALEALGVRKFVKQPSFDSPMIDDEFRGKMQEKLNQKQQVLKIPGDSAQTAELSENSGQNSNRNVLKSTGNLILDERNLKTSQAAQAAQFARGLREIQSQEIIKIIEQFDKKKADAINALQQELAGKLANATTDEEKLKLIELYTEMMRKAADEIENEKVKAIERLVDEMVKDEVRKKKEFFNEKRQEAENAGLDPAVVPETEFDDEYERKLRADLASLAEELARLSAEIQKTWPPKEMSQEAKDKLNEEMAERMRALNALRPAGVRNVGDQGRNSKFNGGEIDVEGEVSAYGRRRNDIQSKMKKKMRNKYKNFGGQTEEETQGETSESGENTQTSVNSKKSVLQADDNAILNAVLETLDAVESEKLGSKVETEFLKELGFLSGDEQLREEMLAKYQKQCENYDLMQSDVKNSLNNRLKERIAARNKLVVDSGLDQAAVKELQKYGRQGTLVQPGNAFENLEKQLGSLDTVQNQQDYEIVKLEQELGDEARFEKQAIEMQSEEQITDFENQVITEATIAAGGDTEQLDKLLLEANNNSNRMAGIINEQKLKQLADLEKRRLDRRNRKMDLLKNHQKIESGQLLNSLSAERSDKIITKIVKNSEKPHEALLQKHALELDNLMKMIDAEEKLGIQKAKQDIRKKREHLRDQLERRKIEEREEIEMNTELGEKDVVLKKFDDDLAGELTQFDVKTASFIKQAKLDPRMKLDHASKNLALRERQLKELANSVKTSTKNSEMDKLLQEAAEEARIESEKARNVRLSIIAKADATIAAAKRAKYEHQRKAHEDRQIEINRRQDELDVKFEKDGLVEEGKLNERIDNKIKQSRTKTDAEIKKVRENATIDENEKERLIKELEESEKLREMKWKNDREKLQNNLMAKLARRKQKRKEIVQDEVIEQGQIEDFAIELSEKEIESDIAVNIAKELAKSDPVMVNNASLLKLPDLTAIEAELKGLHKNRMNASKTPTSSSVVNSLTTLPGIQLVLLDPLDKQWILEGNLTPVKRSSLTSQHLLAWRYAQFSADTLQHVLNMGYNIQIRIASTLPQNNYEKNAFRRSFWFDSAESTLWIRNKRFDNPSDLLVVVAHCMSHIANKDDFNDDNGDFIRNLYVALKSLTSDKFVFEGQMKVLEPSSSELGVAGDDMFDSVVDMKLRVGNDETEYTGVSDGPKLLTGQNQTVSGQFVKNANDSAGKELSKVMTEIERLSLFLSKGQMKMLEQEDEIATRLKLQALHRQKMDIMRNLK